MTGEKVAFQSYARSGNTFLRRYLEQVTGLFTGSDMPMKFTFFEGIMGLLGNNTVCDSNTVWVTKTHYPMSLPGATLPFTANKMIVIVRNPIDVIPSHAHLVNLSSHSLTIEGTWHEDYPEYWEKWASATIHNLKMNHDNVVNTLSKEIPTYYMRYEDLKVSP